MESFTLTSSGCELRVRLSATATPKAVVVILHGMSEHGMRYHPFVEFLSHQGYAAFFHDHRGHGESPLVGGGLGHMGDEDSWNLALDDCRRVLAEAEERFSDTPLVLFGHSMGSFMAQQLMGEHPGRFAAVILSGSNGKPPLLAQAGRLVTRAERVRLGPRGRSTILKELSFSTFNKAFAPNRTDSDWISRDEKMVDAYVDDPLCGHDASVQMWLDLLDALPKLTSKAHLGRIPSELPILLIAGDDDPVGDFGKGVRRLEQSYRHAGMRHVSIRLYSKGRHEMLNETNRDDVMRDIGEWLDITLDNAE